MTLQFRDQSSGRPISAELPQDEDLKLPTRRGIMQADSDKGVPIIERMLATGAPPRMRDRALSVLSRSQSSRAREIMLTTAKNDAYPDLRERRFAICARWRAQTIGRRSRAFTAPRLTRP